jgi:hypothetical protein
MELTARAVWQRDFFVIIAVIITLGLDRCANSIVIGFDHRIDGI